MADSPRDPATMPMRTYRGGGFTTHTGTRAQLLEAGIVGADTPFPGDPGQRKTFVRLTGDPRRVRHIKPAGRGRFTVEVEPPEAEVAAWRAEQEAASARIRADQDRRRAAYQAERDLAAAPRSFDEYRERQSEGCKVLLQIVQDAVGRSGHGYRYAPDVVEEIALHVQAIEGLLERGTIVFDAAARGAHHARLHAVAARGDDRFALFKRKLGVSHG